ncbi:MAG: DMT family transporter [Moraxellaceae bacterium]|nr:DMT family transporter [Moraxellaceae bacterium]
MVAHSGRNASIGMTCAVLGALGFAMKAIFIKLAYAYGVDAETLLALRMGYALPFFIGMGVAVALKNPITLSRRDIGMLFLLGVLGYYLASYLDFLGLQYITAALERITLFIYPTLVVVLSAIFLRKPLTRPALVALAICYAGAILAFAHDLRQPHGDEVMMGTLLVLGSALSYALYIILSGEEVGRLGSTRVAAWATGFACLLSLTQFAIVRPVMSVLEQPWQVHALSLAMAVFSTVLPIWLTSEAIRRLGAGPASMVGTLGPVITILLGWLILGESLGVLQVVGAALVIYGVSRIPKSAEKA